MAGKQIKRTYSRKKAESTNVRILPKDLVNKLSQNDTLDDSIWKDSFDRLQEKKTNKKCEYRKKQSINASFNRNSSLESSIVKRSQKKNKKLKRLRKIVGVSNNDMVSTPKLQIKSKNKNLNFDVSPINQPTPPPFNAMNFYSNLSCKPSKVLFESFEGLVNARKKIIELDTVDKSAIPNDDNLQLILTQSMPKKISIGVHVSPTKSLGESSILLGFNGSHQPLPASLFTNEPVENAISQCINESLSNFHDSISGSKLAQSKLEENTSKGLIENCDENTFALSNLIKSQFVTNRRTRRPTFNGNSMQDSLKIISPTKRKKTVKFNNDFENHQDDSRKSSIILKPGKWRKSLNSWRQKSLGTTKNYKQSIATIVIEESENDETLSQSQVLQYRERESALKLTPSEIVLQHCEQSEPLDFEEFSNNNLRHCRKIGEGVYSEVFIKKCSRTGKHSVLKIIPIEGDVVINGEQQKKFHEILSEIVITKELGNLRYGNEYKSDGFVETLGVQCVQGKYPKELVKLWQKYYQSGKSENDNPGEMFNDDQQYIILELANAGQDLESFKFHNAEQSYSAFLQVATSLAVAEKRFEFEHRDLHWGNVLVCFTNDKTASYRFDNENFEIPTCGVRATIIDFTLSRMLVDKCRHYNDLSQDEELFSASGDYQFEIYRLMKRKLNNNWEKHEPYTNILWLHYLIDKMINSARYRNTKTQKHIDAIKLMENIYKTILNYDCVGKFLDKIKYHNTL